MMAGRLRDSDVRGEVEDAFTAFDKDSNGAIGVEDLRAAAAEVGGTRTGVGGNSEQYDLGYRLTPVVFLLGLALCSWGRTLPHGTWRRWWQKQTWRARARSRLIAFTN